MKEKTCDLSAFLTRMKNKGVTTMSDDEYENAVLIYSLLDDDTSLQMGDEVLSFREFQEKAIELFQIYEDSSLLPSLRPILLNRSESESILGFNTIIDSNSECNGHYPIQKIVCPSKIYSLYPYYLAHEYHHVLKDVSKKEYSYMLRYADVIPQFFELVSGRSFDDQKDLIRNRFALLQNSKRKLEEKIQRGTSNILSRMIDSKNCQYLNSFYYSVLLYSLYQEHPKLVLQKVRDVLNKKMTTAELLDQFGLFQKDFDLEVEQGIQYLKKYSS